MESTDIKPFIIIILKLKLNFPYLYYCYKKLKPMQNKGCSLLFIKIPKCLNMGFHLKT